MLLDMLFILTWVILSVESPREILYHRGFAEEDIRQAYVHYAYDLGWLEFVKMIECENGNRDQNKISKTKDYGICQLNLRYNRDFILSQNYHNIFNQIDYCYEKWKINPKLRYGPDRKIQGQKCSDYVSNRFYLKKIL